MKCKQSQRAFSHLEDQTKLYVFVKLYIFDPVTFGFMLQLCKRTKEPYMTYLRPVAITYRGRWLRHQFGR